METKILVTGGAGYVGSHIVRALLAHGYKPTILDNLSTGFIENIPEGVRLIEADITDAGKLNQILGKENFTAVIHCAAKTSVEEAEKNPDLYTLTNVQGTLNLAYACVQSGVKNVIFSSTAAVYGNQTVECEETLPVSPENWYGMTKVRAEEIIRQLPSQMSCVIFRYFNVCGATEISGDRRKPTMLLTTAVRCAIDQKTFLINGQDYPTLDGTPVRDLVHVEDLARAHVYALREMLSGGLKKETINLGTGSGFSVKTIAAQVSHLYGLKVRPGPRRPGDVATATASNQKARELLTWVPLHTLLSMCQSEYLWQTRNAP